MLGIIDIRETVLMGFLNNRRSGEKFVISMYSLENKRNTSFVLSVTDLAFAGLYDLFIRDV